MQTYERAIEYHDRGLRYLRAGPANRWKHFEEYYVKEKGICLLKMRRPEDALNQLIKAYDLSYKTTKRVGSHRDGPEAFEKYLDNGVKEWPSFCLNDLYQFMCKTHFYEPSHPEFNEIFIRFCGSYKSLRILNEALQWGADQELTRLFLAFFKRYAKNEYFPLRFLNQNRKRVFMFHNSALISDFFRHVSSKKIK